MAFTEQINIFGHLCPTQVTCQNLNNNYHYRPLQESARTPQVMDQNQGRPLWISDKDVKGRGYVVKIVFLLWEHSHISSYGIASIVIHFHCMANKKELLPTYHLSLEI